LNPFPLYGYNFLIPPLENNMTEPTSTDPSISTWLKHIRALAVDIGPRGPTRDGERQGALYAKAQFQRIGLRPSLESFKSARSGFHTPLLCSLLMLVAFIVFPLGGKLTMILAALLSIFAVVSEVMELAGINNPLRMMTPKGDSQNVFAMISPANEHTHDLVLVGHLDSQRTGIIWSTPGWIKAYNIFIMLVFGSFLLQAVVYSITIFFPFSWAWHISILTAVSAVLLAIMLIQIESTPFTAGANDNASGAGMVLTLAEEFQQHPLQHTRVFAVCTGCEEAQHYGIIDFYKRHLSELKKPKAIVFEMLGCISPAWLLKEGIIVPFSGDPGLIHQAEQLAAEHPEWEAHPASISGGNTETVDSLRVKIPAITITGATREGVTPYWHQVADTFDKMRPELMERCWKLTNAMIRRLDNQ
jgi:hypothetical protein